MDPADTVKFGIKWKGKYYMDREVAFAWVHGSGASQMMSDTVIYIMGKENCHTFAYIDEFILVDEENDANRHFDKLSAIFDELGLPRKVFPPLDPLHALALPLI